MNRKDYLDMLDRLSGQIERAFLDAVAVRLKRATLAEVESGVLARDVEMILRAAGVQAADMTMLTETLRAGYIAAAAAESGLAGIVFDIRNPVAERWLASMSSRLIVELLQPQRDAVRIVLEAGMAAGRNPRSVALDIVGRVGLDGTRSGGVVGLNSQAAQWVTNARAELTALDAAYFTRKARDKRFDGIVRKAIRTGQPIQKAKVDAIVSRYAARLLKLRGDAIGRTEALTAIAAGREQAFAQAIMAGEMLTSDVTKIWDATGDGRTRNSHAVMEGQRRAFGVPFTSGLGGSLQFPGDTSSGATAADTINCRCRVQYKINHIAIQARRERGQIQR